MPAQAVRFTDLPYFVGLATMTIYIGAHRGLTMRLRQQISLREVLHSDLRMHAGPARTMVATFQPASMQG